MSEITAVGPRLGIFGPPPEPPNRSLIKTKDVLQPSDAFDGRWLNGLVLQPSISPLETQIWVPCADDHSANTKNPSTRGEPGTFDPVAFVVVDECSTITGDYDGRVERAIATLEAATPWMVEVVFLTGDSGNVGVGGNTNPYLGDGNCQTIGGGPYAPREGLSILDDYIGDNYGGLGMIHGSPGLIDQWTSVLSEDADGTLYTQSGTIVVPGSGYTGEAPDGQAAAGPTQQYAFASNASVQVYLTDIVTRDLAQSLDRENNVVQFVVERFALVTFDGLLQAATLVDYALASS